MRRFRADTAIDLTVQQTRTAGTALRTIETLAFHSLVDHTKDANGTRLYSVDDEMVTGDKTAYAAGEIVSFPTDGRIGGHRFERFAEVSLIVVALLPSPPLFAVREKASDVIPGIIREDQAELTGSRLNAAECLGAPSLLPRGSAHP